MPNSLRAKIDKLKYQGKITEEEHRELVEKLKGHDAEFVGKSDTIDKIRTEIENDWQLKKYPSSPFSCGLRRAVEIINKYKAERRVRNDKI